jgi:hypothetical protein
MLKGPSGRIEGVSLRLYNPEAKQWTLNFANMRDGSLAIPATGRFKNNRGEFFNEDTFKGTEDSGSLRHFRYQGKFLSF